MRVFMVGIMFIMLSFGGTECMALSSAQLNKKFDSIRYNTPKLIAFLYNFPKGADLHNHASGAAYVENFLKLAAKKGYYYDKNKLKIVKSPDAVDGNYISVKELINNDKELKKYLDIVSMRGWHKNTMSGSEHFFRTFQHLGFGELENEVLATIIARNYDQKIEYIEFMYSIPVAEYIEGLKTILPENKFKIADIAGYKTIINKFFTGNNFDDAVKKAMGAREKAINTILHEKYKINSEINKPDIIVKYIPQLTRLASTNYEFFINAVIYMKASQVDENIVASNMVQEEAGLNSLINFKNQMEILDSLWKLLGKPQMALHAGELVLRESPVEPMRNRISQSIIKGHATRIGHGVAIGWEKNVAKTLAMMKDKGIAVEICLSSNDVILDVSGKDHPLAMYMEAGVPITLATDDEGISRSNLTMEYVRAAQEHNLSYAQLKEISKNGLKYSFLGGKGIYGKDWKVNKKYKKYLKGKLPNIDKKINPKQYLQIRHERNLKNFENTAFKYIK